MAVLDALRRDHPDVPVLGRDRVDGGRLATSIGRVHDPSYLRRLGGARSGTALDSPDCPISEGTLGAAEAAAALALAAVDSVLAGEVRRAFVAARPPGHHARASEAMGFCYLNTIAIAAAELLSNGIARVLILDWDVHHGNGTQEIFWEEERVLYASLHRFPFYPGTGAADELGGGAGRGATRNFPMRAGSGDAEYLAVFDGPLAAAVSAFRPEVVLVSAGFDPHVADPLGGQRVTEEGFADWTDRSIAWAEAFAGGRYVSLLEGGYDLPALGRSASMHLGRLAG